MASPTIPISGGFGLRLCEKVYCGRRWHNIKTTCKTNGRERKLATEISKGGDNDRNCVSLQCNHHNNLVTHSGSQRANQQFSLSVVGQAISEEENEIVRTGN